MTESVGRRFRFGPFEIGTDEPVLRRGGALVTLPRRSAALLLALLDRPGRVVPKDELLRRVWPDVKVSEDNLKQAAAALRRALGESADSSRLVDTVSRVGYRFAGNVEVEELGGALPAASAPPPSAPALAVLPFEAATPDAETAALAEGLVDGLTAALARQEGLVVRAAGAVRRLIGTSLPDPSAAARALKVDHIVDGRVRRTPGGLAVSVELIRASDGGVAWAERAEPPLSELPRAAEELAGKLARALRRGRPGERTAAPAGPPGKAYPLYLQGRHYANFLAPDAYEASRLCFENAIREDPTFALAHAGLGYLHLQASEIGLSPGEAMSRARRSSEQALRLDPTLAEAHAVLGLVRFFYDWDPVSAEESFRTAIAIPGWAPGAHRLYGWYLALSGRFDEAFERFAAASDADPLSLERHLYETPGYWLARRWEEGLAATDSMLRLFPEVWLGHILRGRILEGMGEGRRALAAFEEAVSRPGSADEALADLGRRRALEGDRRGARAVLDELSRRAQDHYVPPFHAAQVHAGLCDHDAFFEAIDEAIRSRSWYVTWLGHAHLVDPMRDDPRFAARSAAVGLWQR